MSDDKDLTLEELLNLVWQHERRQKREQAGNRNGKPNEAAGGKESGDR
jgi:hypothetical protein